MNEKAFVFALIMTAVTAAFVSRIVVYGLWDSIVKFASTFGILLAIVVIGSLFYLLGLKLFGDKE